MKPTKLISTMALALALAACGNATDSGTREIADVFQLGDHSLEVVAVALDDGSFEVALGYTTDRASYGASFNVGAADLGANEDLVTLLSQLDGTFVQHISETLRARGVPQDPEHARWFEIERAMFGYADPDSEANYQSCAWGLGQWEYCAGSGMEHCCMFDHGCGWLCSIFY